MNNSNYRHEAFNLLHYKLKAQDGQPDTEPQIVEMSLAQTENFVWYHNRWNDFEHLEVIKKQSTIEIEKFLRIETDQPIRFKAIHYAQELNRPTMTLCQETPCICAETGIEFIVKLPSPLGYNQTMLHPFAFYQNIVSFIKEYQRHGIPLAKLDAQVLAGMLISMLKHKGLTRCKDAMEANRRLRHCNKAILMQALNYFYRLVSRLNLPQINLTTKTTDSFFPAQAEGQLLGFMKICRGEDRTIEVHHMEQRKAKSIKAKVYQTEHEKEAAQIKEDKKTCYMLLDKLQDDFPDVSIQTITLLESKIRNIGTMTDTAREDLAASINNLFPDHPDAKALSLIVLTVVSGAIEKELLSFGMEIESEIHNWKRDKVNLMDLMKAKPKESV